MNESMVERVAQEIYAATWKPGDKADMEKVEIARIQARAAIKAMMEPTDEMLQVADAIQRSYDHHSPAHGPHLNTLTWKAMLTQTLQESPEKQDQ